MADGYTNDGGQSTHGRDDGFGDDQGTRVGRPDRPARDASTGAGAEGAEGIHDVGERDADQPSGVNEHRTGREGLSEDEQRRRAESGMSASGGRSGSEPLQERDRERRSGYGGSAGEPVAPSDMRAEGEGTGAVGSHPRHTLGDEQREVGNLNAGRGVNIGGTAERRPDTAHNEGGTRRPREQMEEDI